MTMTQEQKNKLEKMLKILWRENDKNDYDLANDKGMYDPSVFDRGEEGKELDHQFYNGYSAALIDVKIALGLDFNWYDYNEFLL